MAPSLAIAYSINSAARTILISASFPATTPMIALRGKPFSFSIAVATIQRLAQRTIESFRPIPGTVSPRVAIRTPSGPSETLFRLKILA
jgi:hypothetical protein